MKVESAVFIRSAHGGPDLIRDGRAEVAFAGRSNVGKSSLMNCLLGRRGLARTSSSPGRTRSINYFLINDRFYFVDLPGYGYAKASRGERQAWARLVDGYLRHARPRTRIVLLVDAKVGATQLDVQAYDYLRSLGADVTVVATKVDRVPRSQRARALAGIRRVLDLGRDEALIPVSARTGEGVKELWREMTPHLRMGKTTTASPG